MLALMRVSFWMLRFFFGRRLCHVGRERFVQLEAVGDRIDGSLRRRTHSSNGYFVVRGAVLGDDVRIVQTVTF